jgi:hypothetical protein
MMREQVFLFASSHVQCAKVNRTSASMKRIECVQMRMVFQSYITIMMVSYN